MELIIDDRERINIVHKNISIKIERLTVGDYAIFYMGRLLAIIERKTLKDLSASLRDGRMENFKSLLECREKCGCVPILLIEGRLPLKSSVKYCRIPYKALRGKIDSLAINHNIYVVHTSCVDDTIDRILSLCNTFLKKEQVNNNVKEGGDKKLVQMKVQKPVHVYQIKMLQKIPLMSWNICTILLKKYTLRELLLGQAKNEEISQLTYPSGISLRNKALKLIKNLSDYSPYETKMLSIVPGITLPTAKLIIDKITFKELLAGADISQIRKTEKRKIGKALNVKIHNILNC